jgi:hypothetical protein
VIELIDITGRVVGALFDGDLSVGEHEQEVSGAGLPSGRYFLRLTTAGETALYPVQLVR